VGAIDGYLHIRGECQIFRSFRSRPTGGCLEYFLNEGVLGQLVKLSEADRPFGIRGELKKCRTISEHKS
jgi:hypothetical protein